MTCDFHRRAALAVALAGAALPGCGMDAIPVVLIWDGTDSDIWDDTPTDADDMLDQTAAILGVPIERVDDRWGAITVHVRVLTRDDLGQDFGHAYDKRGCRRSVWAAHRPVVIAHEIGHVLGLKHSGRPNDVMNETILIAADALTDEQTNDVMDGLRRFSICKRSK